MLFLRIYDVRVSQTLIGLISDILRAVGLRQTMLVQEKAMVSKTASTFNLYCDPFARDPLSVLMNQTTPLQCGLASVRYCVVSNPNPSGAESKFLSHSDINRKGCTNASYLHRTRVACTLFH